MTAESFCMGEVTAAKPTAGPALQTFAGTGQHTKTASITHRIQQMHSACHKSSCHTLQCAACRAASGLTEAASESSASRLPADLLCCVVCITKHPRTPPSHSTCTASGPPHEEDVRVDGGGIFYRRGRRVTSAAGMLQGVGDAAAQHLGGISPHLLWEGRLHFTLRRHHYAMA